MNDEYYLTGRIQDLINENSALRASYMTLEQDYKDLLHKYEMLANDNN
jgi:hypothetical protein